ERARLRLANDAALCGSLELGPFDAHGRNRVSTTKPILPHERAATATSGGAPPRLRSGDAGQGAGIRLAAGFGAGPCGREGVEIHYERDPRLEPQRDTSGSGRLYPCFTRPGLRV